MHGKIISLAVHVGKKFAVKRNMFELKFTIVKQQQFDEDILGYDVSQVCGT